MLFPSVTVFNMEFNHVLIHRLVISLMPYSTKRLQKTAVQIAIQYSNFTHITTGIKLSVLITVALRQFSTQCLG